MNRIKFITIIDNDIIVTTRERVSEEEYNDIIISNIKSHDFCDITYDGSYTTIISRKHSI